MNLLLTTFELKFDLRLSWQQLVLSPKIHNTSRVVKLLLIVIVMKSLWRESNSNSNRLVKIPEYQ